MEQIPNKAFLNFSYPSFLLFLNQIYQEKQIFQNEIAKSSYTYQKAVEAEQESVVGVNCYQDKDERTRLETLRVDPVIEAKQIRDIHIFRSSRNHDNVQRSLDTIRNEAKSEAELLPHILDAVETGATLGEISDALRDVFGEYKSDGS